MCSQVSYVRQRTHYCRGLNPFWLLQPASPWLLAYFYQVIGRPKACLWIPATFCTETGSYVPLQPVCCPLFSSAALTLSIQRFCGRPKIQLSSWATSWATGEIVCCQTCPYRFNCTTLSCCRIPFTTLHRRGQGGCRGRCAPGRVWGA